MTTIVVFASSLFIVSTLVFIKAVELKREKRGFLFGLIGKLDSRSDRFINNLKFRALQFIQSTRYIILVQTKAMLKSVLCKLEDKIMDEYKSRQNIMMGRRNITNKGSVSFYLKRITETKGNGRGKIEERL